MRKELCEKLKDTIQCVELVSLFPPHERGANPTCGLSDEVWGCGSRLTSHLWRMKFLSCGDRLVTTKQVEQFVEQTARVQKKHTIQAL